MSLLAPTQLPSEPTTTEKTPSTASVTLEWCIAGTVCAEIEVTDCADEAAAEREARAALCSAEVLAAWQRLTDAFVRAMRTELPAGHVVRAVSAWSDVQERICG